MQSANHMDWTRDTSVSPYWFDVYRGYIIEQRYRNKDGEHTYRVGVMSLASVEAAKRYIDTLLQRIGVSHGQQF